VTVPRVGVEVADIAVVHPADRVNLVVYLDHRPAVRAGVLAEVVVGIPLVDYTHATLLDVEVLHSACAGAWERFPAEALDDSRAWVGREPVACWLPRMD